MHWPSVLRASRFFIVAGVTWFALGLIRLFRGSSGARMDIYLHVGNVLVPPSHAFLLAGSILVIFGGVYGLFEQRHARPVNLILGHMHFWLTAVPLAILSLALHQFSHAAGAASGDVNVQGLLQTQTKVFLWCLLTLLLGQFVFLADLAISFFRKRAGAR